MQIRTYPRPIPVSGIAVALLIHAVLAPTLYGARSGPGWNDPASLALVAALAVACGICGGFMLKGANFSRPLYFLGVMPLQLFAPLPDAEPFIITRIVIPSLMGLFLISSSSNRYFTGRNQFFKPAELNPQAAQRERSGTYEY